MLRHRFPSHEHVDVHPVAEREYEVKKWKRRRRRFVQKPRLQGLLAVIVGVFTLYLLFRMLWYFLFSETPSPVVLPENIRVSVVMMNHNRPNTLQGNGLLETLSAHPHVGEILLTHSRNDTAFHYEHSKVENIDAVQKNDEMGLALRFHYCRQAENDFVIHVDDDQLLTRLAIDRLLLEFSKNTERIVGKFGRRHSYWRAPFRHGYDTTTLVGPVEVVLTKFMVLERRMCDSFFQYAPLMEDLLEESHPRWNGEDIFMSLVANKVYGKGSRNNFAIHLADVQEAPILDEDIGISGNMDLDHVFSSRGVRSALRAYGTSNAHANYRGIFWETAKRRLALVQETPV